MVPITRFFSAFTHLLNERGRQSRSELKEAYDWLDIRVLSISDLQL